LGGRRWRQGLRQRGDLSLLAWPLLLVIGPSRATEEVIMEEQVGKGALVIGGGIAGIQAALDLADSRIRVTLVERSPSLGGRMAQLDKTFPTMDCSI
jgi:heterodisulfide reductase subunit A-like polyferredoxin